jgi:uncharacterized protein (DUF305 family)
MKKAVARPAIAAAAWLVLALAAGVADAQSPAAGSRRPRHTPADVRFMQQMTDHHGQALLMTELVRERTSSETIKLLARRIEVSQRDEIGWMRQWLADRREAVSSAEVSHRHEIPGMLTEAELSRLRSASGAEFDRLFLTGMIRHHEGALTMVAQLFATPGAGQETESFRFASDVEADQRAEIARMRALLK